MDFKFFCPDCNQKMIMADEYFGYPIECPNCQSHLALLPDGPIEPVPVATFSRQLNQKIENVNVAPPPCNEYKFIVVEMGNVEAALNFLLKEGWYVVSQSTVLVSEKKNGLQGIVGTVKKEGIAYTLARQKLE